MKPRLDELGVRVVAISSDVASDSRALRERLGLEFPLLSDEGAAVAAAYGLKMKGEDIAVPSTLIVMPGHEIYWKYVGETPSDRPTEEIMLEELERALGARRGGDG